MSIFTENLASEYDMDVADVEDVWQEKIHEVEEESDMQVDQFSPKEFKECEKRTRAYLEAESMIRVGHFFESDMDAEQFLETLVSGNFNISNIVNKKKDEDNDDDDYVLNEESDDEYDDEEMLDEEEDLGYIDEEESMDEEMVTGEPEGEVVPDIMTEERARQILGASSGVSVGNSVPAFLR